MEKESNDGRTSASSSYSNRKREMRGLVEGWRRIQKSTARDIKLSADVMQSFMSASIGQASCLRRSVTYVRHTALVEVGKSLRENNIYLTWKKQGAQGRAWKELRSDRRVKQSLIEKSKSAHRREGGRKRLTKKG